ncbi:hypothetical protein [Microbacterium sp. LWO12-1.2]|uniref:hypothetical protein n=1 Tax=Microbacterium sp. LWO12-1.2 TaxID=3135261 RepID=UPI00342FD10F
MPRFHSTHRRSLARPALAACCVALSAVGILGCSPTPEPEPTPTPAFASEEEAFAAAEETYRAYNDALNAERAGTSPSIPSHDFLAGEVLRAEVANETKLREDGIRIEGSTTVSAIQGLDADLVSPVGEVLSRVCLDITDARAIDTTGVDVTAEGRSDIYAVDVRFAGGPQSLLITDFEITADFEC